MVLRVFATIIVHPTLDDVMKRGNILLFNTFACRKTYSVFFPPEEPLLLLLYICPSPVMENE